MSAIAKPLRCLLVEDVEDDALLMLRQLHSGGYDVTSERVDTPEAMRAALDHQPWDIVLSDYQMPRFSGLAALELLQASGLDLPFIIVSGTIGEDIAVEAMRLGAHDYLMKGKLARLVPAVERELRNAMQRRESKRAQEALWESEEKFKAFFERSNIGLSMTSLSGGLKVNRALCDMLGYSLAEMQQQTWQTITHPEDVEPTQRMIDLMLAGKQDSVRFTKRFLHKHGAVVWADLSSMLRRDEAGRAAYLISAIVDITEHKQAEAALRANEAKYSRLVEGAPDIIYTFSSQRGGLYYSAHAEVVLGYSVKHLLAHPLLWQNSIEPADLERIRLAIQKFATGEPFDLEYRIKDSAGRWHWLRDRSIGCQQVGDDLIIEGIVTDITVSKQAQEALHHHQTMLTRTEQIALIGSWEWEIATGTVAWSEELFHIFQRDPAKGAPSFAEQEQIYHPEDMAQLKGAVVAAVNEGRAYELELRAIRADGETRVCLARGHAEMGAGGKVIRLFGSLQDLTERKQAEAVLRETLREKEALLHEVHHRVKNNLQVISSLLSLEARRDLEPGTKAVLQEMKGRIRSMALLHETLYHTKNFARVDLAGYLREVAVKLFRAQNADLSAVRLVLELAAAEVELDQAMPCGLLVNELLTNALKHGFPDGRHGEVRLGLQQTADGRVHLQVSDDGIGLPADFDLSRANTLGLQLVLDLTRQLQGVMAVGPGASFKIVFTPKLPRARKTNA